MKIGKWKRHGERYTMLTIKVKVKVKSLSRVRLLATPWTAAYQAPPSMGFSRQEYWSGVPLPSLSNKCYLAVYLCCAMLSLSVMDMTEWLFVTPWAVAHQVPLSMGFSSMQEYWSELPCIPPGDLSNPGIEPRSPTLQTDSLPAEPPGKPRNTEVGSLSLLQGIFPTQELNPGLLHCRQFLYQLRGKPQPTTYWMLIMEKTLG